MIEAYISVQICVLEPMESNNKGSQEDILVALTRFNREFQRMERNFDALAKQTQKISMFIEHQKRLLKK